MGQGPLFKYPRGFQIPVIHVFEPVRGGGDQFGAKTAQAFRRRVEIFRRKEKNSRFLLINDALDLGKIGLAPGFIEILTDRLQESINGFVAEDCQIQSRIKTFRGVPEVKKIRIAIVKNIAEDNHLIITGLDNISDLARF